MSVGLKLLRALVDGKTKNSFRKVNREWFTDEEVVAYDFVRQHFRSFGVLPDVKTMNENGVKLPKAEQPFNYYLSRIQSRTVYNLVSSKHSELLEAMKARDTQATLAIVSEMSRAGRAIANTNDHSVIVQEAALIEEAYFTAKTSQGVQGITLGYAPLDNATDGIHGGEVIVIAGRPNIGKSYTLLKACVAAWEAGNVPLVVSMEMGSANLARRIIAMKSGLNPDFIRKGQLSTMTGEPKFLETIDGLKNMPPIHFLRGNFKKNTGDIDSAIQELNPDVVYVDAAYELKPEGSPRNKAKWEQISEVFTELKTIAENRDIGIVATVQIARDGERTGKKVKKTPSLSHVGGADAIAQIVDVLVMMYNGLAPKEKTTRDYFLVKNREGDNNIRFQSNFTFSPMNFNYIEGTSGDVDFEPEENQEDMSDREEAGYEI